MGPCRCFAYCLLDGSQDAILIMSSGCRSLKSGKLATAIWRVGLLDGQTVDELDQRAAL